MVVSWWTVAFCGVDIVARSIDLRFTFHYCCIQMLHLKLGLRFEPKRLSKHNVYNSFNVKHRCEPQIM